MEASFSFLDLIEFLREQQTVGFQTINMLLSVMDDPNMSEERKIAITIAIFRNSGLFEQDYEEEVFFEHSEEFQDVDSDPSWEDDIMIPMGFYYARLIDKHIIEIAVIMN